MIEAKLLTKKYDRESTALDRLDLRVESGEIYCLLGANGAGKTTTINLFLGFIDPTSGSAEIGGVNVHEQPLKAKARVGYLSENVRLYGNLTARQNLHFFAELSGSTRSSREAYYEVLGEAGLPEAAFEKKVREFSKGMQQKVGISIAIIKGAEALFLDEPMSGLDPTASADFVQILGRLREQGKAILMSTHDIFRAREIADHVGIMKAGRKVAELGREDILREDLEQLYLSTMRDDSA